MKKNLISLINYIKYPNTPVKGFVFDLTIFLFSLIFLFSSFFITKFLMFIPLVIVVTYLLIMDEKRSLAFLFLLLPIAPIMKFSSSTPSLITFFEIEYVVILCIKKKSIPIKRNIFLILILFFFCLFLVTIANSFSVLQLAGFVLPFIIFCLSMNCAVDSESDLSLGMRYVFGLILACIIGLFLNKIPNLASLVLSAVSDQVIDAVSRGILMSRYFAIYGDPNLLSFYVLGAIIVVFSLYSKNKINWYIFYPIFLLLSLFGLLTISKNFLLLYLITIIVYFLIFIIQNKVHRVVTMISLFITLLFFGFFFSSTFRNILNSYIFRIFEDNASSVSSLSNITTGRTDIWAIYLQDIFSGPSFLFGKGLYGGVAAKIASHNSFIQLFYMSGIFGAALFIFVFFFYFFYLRKSNFKLTLTFSASFIIIFIQLLSLDLIVFDALYFILILIFSFLKIPCDYNNDSVFNIHSDFITLCI